MSSSPAHGADMPELCDFHALVIRNLSEKDHVGDCESERAAVELARQCRTGCDTKS